MTTPPKESLNKGVRSSTKASFRRNPEVTVTFRMLSLYLLRLPWITAFAGMTGTQRLPKSKQSRHRETRYQPATGINSSPRRQGHYIRGHCCTQPDQVRLPRGNRLIASQIIVILSEFEESQVLLAIRPRGGFKHGSQVLWQSQDDITADSPGLLKLKRDCPGRRLCFLVPILKNPFPGWGKVKGVWTK